MWRLFYNVHETLAVIVSNVYLFYVSLAVWILALLVLTTKLQRKGDLTSRKIICVKPPRADESDILAIADVFMPVLQLR